MKPVLCFGDICPDLLLPYGAALAAMRGEKVAPDDLSVRFSHGGSVANTASGIARLGVPVRFLGTAGEDHFGRVLREGLEEEGVDVSMLTLKKELMTVQVLIVLDEKGERIPFAYPRTKASQHQITPDQAPPELAESISWMHSSGMTLREDPAAHTQLGFMALCKEKGVPVSLDINARLESREDSTFASCLRAALPLCTVLLGSLRDELCPLADTDDPDEAIDLLLEQAPMVVARMGDHGAIVATREGRSHSPAFPAKVLDTVGAGDVYNAGFIAALLEGCDPKEANRRALCCGSWCVSHPGGRSGPTKKELFAALNG